MPKGGSRIGAGRKPHARATAAFTPGLPPPPTWLSAPARSYYRLYGRELEDAGVITHADRDALALYANALADIAELNRLTHAKGFQRVIVSELGPKTNPLITQHQQACSRARMLAQDLGLTPASRGRIQVVAPVAQSAEQHKRTSYFSGPRLVKSATR